jgi:DUF4097 and DUF4098 domain-containing protein YvlB
MPEPLRLKVSTRSGKVEVLGGAAALHIEGGSVVGEHDGVLDVRRDRGAAKIVVRCPAGSDLTIGTVSGNVELQGELGDVRVATISGKVRIAAARRVDVRAKSGGVDVHECEGECRVVVTSAKVHVGHAKQVSVAGVSGAIIVEGAEGADVKTVSGKVLLGTTGPGHVVVRTVSGKVDVRVPPDVQPATRLRSVSGRVACECDSGTDGEIAVATVSGAIRVCCT